MPRKGTKSLSKPKVKAGLLSTNFTNPNQYAPTWFVLNEKPEQIIQPWERRWQITRCIEIFATIPIVTAAILNKNKIAVGPAWQPVFGGDIRKTMDAQGNIINDPNDVAWVDAAVKWLTNEYYPNLNWQGQNFSFNDTLVSTGKDIDVCGGSLMIYRTTKAGLPRIELYTPDRIGSRNGEVVVSGGSYDGYKIFDGIVYNPDNMPVALKLLGSTPDTDQIISLFNCQYLFEPFASQYGHGIPRISFAMTNLMDVKDINENLKITVKNLSRKAIIHKNAKGKAPSGKRIFGLETPVQAPATEVSNYPQNKIFFETVNKGSTEYISSTDGSDITPFQFDTPNPNTEAFVYRQMAEAIAAIGWFIELVTPGKLNGTSNRMIQDEARKLIVWRQKTLERRAKAIVNYGLAVAMQQGLIPKTDNPSWGAWLFNRPCQLTIDAGYDSAAQVEALKLGLTTKQEICALRGKDWVDVDKQVMVELSALFKRAQQFAKEFNITEAEAREWLSKRDIDVIAPQVAKDEPQDPEAETTKN